MAYLGLFAPVLERLAFVAVKVAVDSMAATWPALYIPMPSDYFSDLPLQVIFLLTILTSIFCYTTIGSKMLKLSSQFDLLLVKQLTACLLYPHCISLNHAAYCFTLKESDCILWENFLYLMAKGTCKNREKVRRSRTMLSTRISYGFSSNQKVATNNFWQIKGGKEPTGHQKQPANPNGQNY
ncbi:hypothetical protein DSO57_1008932 [Entomophthora muscae]|uniref:Uncharacterized protein n=1 Tax=Entomophthora muscae TaxID=34485 RepID=A0ACC2T6S3_9FUNG|nr:hypothetical protein DSO57_1008932 [Entomophthora muscae]